MGAPLGNQNAKNGKEFLRMLKQVLSKRGDGDYFVGLEKVATVLVESAVDERQPWAMQEIMNRIDGKPAQIVAAEDENGNRTSFEEIVIRGVIAAAGTLG